MSKVQIWAAQTRANFLFLAVFLVAIGLAYAAKYDSVSAFNWLHAILILVGTITAHISVNLFNEYSDYQTRIDFNTKRTPFSGGSGMMPAEKTKPLHVKIAAYATLLFSGAIGLYFSIVSHYSIIIIALIGAFAIVYYTPLLAKMLLGELFAGLALGSLVVIGAFIAMTATPGMTITEVLPLEVLLISIPPGILTALLLLLNEFPDVEADKAGGRKHLVIKYGKKASARLYALGMFLTFAIILFIPLAGLSSYWLLIALLPLPLAIKATQTAIAHGNDMQKLIPALGMNVMVVLGTDLLIAIAVIIQL